MRLHLRILSEYLPLVGQPISVPPTYFNVSGVPVCEVW
jgi:hypothetical protein